MIRKILIILLISITLISCGKKGCPKNNEKDKCIEVGVILFSISNRAVLAQQSFLLPSSSNKAELINKIPVALSKIPQPIAEALVYLEALINCSDLIVAHNSDFDKQWFGKDSLPAINKPWICTMDDIGWPRELHLKIRPSVRDLALAYGVPVWNAHRALTDCIYIAEVFRRCEDLEELIIKGLEPKSLYKAEISYDQRKLAKEAGFRWNDPVKGAWTRKLSNQDAIELPFKVKVIS